MLDSNTTTSKRRLIPSALFLAILLGYLQAVYAFLGPGDLDRTGDVYVAFWYAAFLCRTFLWHVGLAFVVMGAIALALKRSRLAIATLPLIGLTFFPHLDGAKALAASRSVEADSFRLMTINLRYDNRRFQEVLHVIRDASPDMLLLQEYTHFWHDAMMKSLSETYPHWAGQPKLDPHGSAIYSKIAFAEEPVGNVMMGPGTHPAKRIVTKCGQERFAIYNVHLLPPVLDTVVEMRRQFVSLRDFVAGDPLPIILGGDFNYTEASRMHRQMLRNGLVDAQEAVGTAWRATWPTRGMFSIFPGVRIDRYYVSPSISILRCRSVDIPGSDHRGLVLDVGQPN